MKLKSSWKSRIIKWLIICLTSTIILLGLGVLAIELFINTALKEIASSEPQQTAIVPENRSNKQETLTTAMDEPVDPVDPNSSPTTQEQADLEPLSKNNDGDVNASVKDENISQEITKEEASNDTGSTPNEETTENAESSSNVTSEKTIDNTNQYESNISPELAEIAQEQITISEKAKLTKMLLNKLTPKEVTLFIKMTSNGVSVEEKKAAKKIILEKLTPEEFDELILIAKRLGLSEGRPYEETIKDYENESQTP
jgi:hypothetical protein